jgi:hypothetical protein
MFHDMFVVPTIKLQMVPVSGTRKGLLQKMRAVLLLALIASASAFAPTLSSLTGRQARQRACFSGIRMQKDDNSER